ncbi:MAG: sel1 repeat family protein [Magnetococcales bacterium]|nr:sel1 repeat family protein [Magnetococcales bacterium]NGZ07405.1 sel1 repeat family protein [Magnetococcales bacterium]
MSVDLEMEMESGVMMPPKEQIDPDRYLALIQALASGGNARAQHNLGAMYLKGLGVTRDSVRALEWFLKAGAQGEVLAQHNLGTMYLRGIGVAKDPVQAFDWFRRAALQGDARAAHCVGALYFEGLGVARDPVRAMIWLSRAANGVPEELRAANQQAMELARQELDASAWAYVEERIDHPGEDD